MTIAEALMKRKDLTRDVGRIKEEVTSNMLINKEDSDTVNDLFEDQNDRLNLYSQLMYELEELNLRINRANESIQKQLEAIKILDSKIAFYNQLRVIVLTKKEQFPFRMDKVIEYISILSLNDVNSRLVDLENKRRELDKDIQRYNWNTEI